MAVVRKTRQPKEVKTLDVELNKIETPPEPSFEALFNIQSIPLVPLVVPTVSIPIVPEIPSEPEIPLLDTPIVIPIEIPSIPLLEKNLPETNSTANEMQQMATSFPVFHPWSEMLRSTINEMREIQLEESLRPSTDTEMNNLPDISALLEDTSKDKVPTTWRTRQDDTTAFEANSHLFARMFEDTIFVRKQPDGSFTISRTCTLQENEFSIQCKQGEIIASPWYDNTVSKTHIIGDIVHSIKQKPLVHNSLNNSFTRSFTPPVQSVPFVPQRQASYPVSYPIANPHPSGNHPPVCRPKHYMKQESNPNHRPFPSNRVKPFVLH